MDILNDYLAAFDDLRTAFDGMTRDQLIAQPVEGKWSAMEVLCHLVDTDLMTAMRIRAALQRDTPETSGLDLRGIDREAGRRGP